MCHGMAVLKMYAILLKYLTFEGFSNFHWQLITCGRAYFRVLGIYNFDGYFNQNPPCILPFIGKFIIHIMCQLHSLSLDILGRPQKLGPSSTFYLTMLISVKLKVENGTNFCGLLRLSKLYKSVYRFEVLFFLFFYFCFLVFLGLKL